jgi:hypothetical protein
MNILEKIYFDREQNIGNNKKYSKSENKSKKIP